MTDCIFCKIVRGEIPSRRVYEDADMLAFHDINPVAPVHFMVIPKKHIDSLATAQDSDAPVLGRMMASVPGATRSNSTRRAAPSPPRAAASSSVETSISASLCISRRV